MVEELAELDEDGRLSGEKRAMLQVVFPSLRFVPTPLRLVRSVGVWFYRLSRGRSCSNSGNFVKSSYVETLAFFGISVELYRLGGKKGGPARAKKLTKKQRSDIAKNAAKARWKKDD